MFQTAHHELVTYLSRALPSMWNLTLCEGDDPETIYVVILLPNEEAQLVTFDREEVEEIYEDWKLQDFAKSSADCIIHDRAIQVKGVR